MSRGISRCSAVTSSCSRLNDLVVRFVRFLQLTSEICSASLSGTPGSFLEVFTMGCVKSILAYLPKIYCQEFMMRRSRITCACGLLIVVLWSAGCIGHRGNETTAPTSTVPPVATLTSVQVKSAVESLIIGQTTQMIATGAYSDGSTKDVSSAGTWGSSNSGIVTVSLTGLTTAVAAGQANVTASLNGTTGQSALAVNPRTLTSLNVAPSTLSMYLTGKQQLEASGTYNDGSIEDDSSKVTWISSSPTVATVSSTGLVQAVTAGNSVVSATQGSVNANVNVSVANTNTGFTIVDDQGDGRLFTFQGTDSSILTFVGAKDGSGNPTSLYGIHVAHSDGTSQDLGFDTQSRITTISSSDGSQFGFGWSNTTTAGTAGVVTIIPGDRSALYFGVSCSSNGNCHTHDTQVQ